MELWCHDQLQKCPERIVCSRVVLRSNKRLGDEDRAPKSYRSYRVDCIHHFPMETLEVRGHIACQSTIQENMPGIENPIPLKPNNIHEDQKQAVGIFTMAQILRVPSNALPSNPPFQIHFYPMVIIALFTTIFTHILNQLFGGSKRIKSLSGTNLMGINISLAHLTILVVLSALIPSSNQGIIESNRYNYNIYYQNISLFLFTIFS